ncbi:replication-associated recombination protein A [candidate division KSB1 bacterium]|nr:replication-associated recombination protein A [candidate division KSB1 bacterium]
MTDLFEKTAREAANASIPLADRVRPQTLDEFMGQAHLVGAGKVLRNAIEHDDLISMIFWGPPGVGKTTLAKIIARETESVFYAISAVTSGVGEVRKIIEKAEVNRKSLGQRTVLFIDEIHRFNKAQQDALLHSVEDGTICLIGATTENPSFEVISPLLSRCRVYQLHALTESDIRSIIDRALKTDTQIERENLEFDAGVLEMLVKLSGGDARIALNTIELAARFAQRSADGQKIITQSILEETLQRRIARYDKTGDAHYDTISAFIKSVRGSDPDAALHYLARMLDSGEDPKFIARRLVILASEDIGNADPLALVIATSAFTAVTYIGMPEGQLVLAQTTTYLASANKSNASYLAIKAAMEDVKKYPDEPIPMHLRNAPTKLMEQFGYADGYQYPHDFPGHFVDETYLPEKLKHKIYYHPTDIGHELKLKERLMRWWQQKRR